MLFTAMVTTGERKDRDETVPTQCYQLSKILVPKVATTIIITQMSVLFLGVAFVCIFFGFLKIKSKTFHIVHKTTRHIVSIRSVLKHHNLHSSHSFLKFVWQSYDLAGLPLIATIILVNGANSD